MADSILSTLETLLGQLQSADPATKQAVEAAFRRHSFSEGVSAVEALSSTGKPRLEFQRAGKVIYMGKGQPAVLYPGMVKLIVDHLNEVKKFAEKHSK